MECNKGKKIEFHVHTIKSKDSLLSKYFILFMCKLKKINCLAITDHNEIEFAKKNKFFFENSGIDVIIGEEIFTKDGEIIGLFLNEKIEPNLTVEKTIEEIRRQNGLVYVPHPYDLKRIKTVLKEDKLKEICQNVDFIEKHNGRNIMKEYSEIQNDLADKYNITKIVGSDAHTFYELGRNYCIVNSYSKENLIDEIKNAIFVEKKCLKVAHLNTKLVKVAKMIFKGDFYEIFRIVKRKTARRK